MGTKVGNVATIFVESRSPVFLETRFHTIGYLKPGCYPKTTTDVFWGTANVSGSTAWLMLRVGTDGKISTYMTYAPTSTTVSVMRASATFVTA